VDQQSWASGIAEQITHRRTEKTVRSGADGMKAKIGRAATMSP
jgi:hypothetical protein